ncbi:MAG: endonuclease III [Firmicutes bacterium]|jgi:endonuclease-3|nr:endonuclease III [Bacillota bacterium]MBQ1430888.1 endonuclease III [Bacillota bacterium]MBQ1630913.1 endonuclease III [Bacillota bacterium]MBQ1690325.1 endonuclease III [Bacillota bacterium]MBQ1825393.1 endonuclease III [Bacillota bacterium]
MKNKDVVKVLDILKETYPEAGCALDYGNRFQLLISVVLSAQTTDKSVNKVTPLLFSKYPDPVSLASADETDVQEIIRTIGMYRTKAKNIIALSGKLALEFNGQVPGTMEELMSLPGVGRKTSNVVLAEGFGEQRIAVDTHVFRVSNRIGLAHEKDVLSTEEALMKAIPSDRWTEAHHLLIFHGRRICSSQRPKCDTCPINEYCNWFKHNAIKEN